MREIKFRVWDGKRMSTNTATIQEIYNKDSLRDGNAFIWLQYTGLKDKNGKEIYEGDVCKTYYSNERNFMNVGSIVFEEGSFSLLSFDDDITYVINPGNHMLCEVIGNIYENPELLNQNQ